MMQAVDGDNFTSNIRLRDGIDKGMDNNDAAGADNLQAGCLKHGGNEIKRKENDGNCDQPVRGRRKAINIEERDYLSVV